MARASRRVDVVDLQHHLHQLCRQANLLFLANERLKHVLFFHVYGDREEAPLSERG